MKCTWFLYFPIRSPKVKFLPVQYIRQILVTFYFLLWQFWSGLIWSHIWVVWLNEMHCYEDIFAPLSYTCEGAGGGDRGHLFHSRPVGLIHVIYPSLAESKRSQQDANNKITSPRRKNYQVTGDITVHIKNTTAVLWIQLNNLSLYTSWPKRYNLMY